MFPCFLTGIFYATILVTFSNWWPNLLMKDLPPPTACMSAAMMGRSCEHIWPPTPASARAHTKDGNQHGTFSFSRARHWEGELCVGHWSILVWGIRVNLHWPVDPISVGCQPGQLAVCSRMRTPVWITSIRTQPETFSFTLLTSAGSKLKSCSPPLRWCKQF